jgi:DHA1 family inner membrane transport protein
LPDTAANQQNLARTNWLIISVLLAAGAFSAVNLGKVPAILPALRAEFGLSAIEAGWVTAIFAILGMTIAVVVGAGSDQIGQKRLLVAGLLTQTAGAVVGSTSVDLSLLVTTRIIEGIGFLMVSVSVPPLIVACARPRDVGAALGLWGANVPLGFATALVAMPALIGPVGWRGAWILTGAMTAAILLIALMLLGKITLAPRDPGNVVRRTTRSLSNPGLLLLMAIFAVYALQWTSLMVWLPTFFIETNALSLSLAAALTAVIVLANALGNVAGGQLLARAWPATRIIKLGSLAMGLFGAAILLADVPVWARVVLCICFSGFGGLMPAGMIASITRYVRSGNQLAAASGQLLQGANIGHFFGPPLLAWAVSLAGGSWSGAVVPMAVAAVISFVLATILSRYDASLRR